MKMKITLLVCLVILAGCQSEIDKCVGAIKRDHSDKTEAQARLLCLQAASGKN